MPPRSQIQFRRSVSRRHAIPVLAVLLLMPSVVLSAAPPGDAAWQVLDGPEKERGDAVQIVEGTRENLEVLVAKRRGTVMRHFEETPLPATLTFRFQTRYDPQAGEVPTELFGTGDFRIFVGTRVGNEEKTGLGGYEGFQFRLFPHLGDSPERVKTGDESHTATSLWIRYSDPKRRLDSLGLPHTGLLSDAGRTATDKTVSIMPDGHGSRCSGVGSISGMNKRHSSRFTSPTRVLGSRPTGRPSRIAFGPTRTGFPKSTPLRLLTPTPAVAIRPIGCPTCESLHNENKVFLGRPGSTS